MPASPDAEASHRTKGLLRLTMACNERCPFCNVPVEAYPRPTPPDAEVDAALDAFVAAGERTLTISGGEPTLLRRRLLGLIRRARDRGIDLVELQTNAILIDADYAVALAAAGLTSAFVSLLSHVPEHHDALAGLSGAFPRCLAGIDALLDAGVRVTLNPVTAQRTQALLADYVDFVAARLPRVRSISASAVQPHGRAVEHPDLLPDYAILGPTVREARRRAGAHGLELVNPYCGLPLCVGWEDGQDVSVEAIEARLGGWRDTPGVENTGDKRHGAPCAGCALRTRCGGAWHAYWALRGGSGLTPPLRLVSPWVGTGPGQAVLRALGDAPDAPTLWLWTTSLPPVDALLASPVTDVALEARAPLSRDTLRALRRLARQERPPARRVRVRVGLRGAAPALVEAVDVLVAVGVDAIRLLDADPRVAAALVARHPGVDLAPEAA